MGGYNLLDATLPELADQTGLSFFAAPSPGSIASFSCEGDPLRELSALLGNSVLADTTNFDFEHASDMALLKDEGASFLADQSLFTTANLSRYSPSKNLKLSTMAEEEDSEGEALPVDLVGILPKKLSRPVAIPENLAATPTATHSLTGLLRDMHFTQGDTGLIVNERSPIGMAKLTKSPRTKSSSPSKAVIKTPLTPRSASPTKPKQAPETVKHRPNSYYASAIADSESRIRALLSSRTPSKTPYRPPPVASRTLVAADRASPSKATLFQTPTKQLFTSTVVRSQQRSAIRSQTYSELASLLDSSLVKQSAPGIKRSDTLTAVVDKSKRQSLVPSSNSQAALIPSAKSQPNLARLARPSAIRRPSSAIGSRPVPRKASLQDALSEPQKPLGSRYGFAPKQNKVTGPRTSQVPAATSSSRASTKPVTGSGSLRRRPA